MTTEIKRKVRFEPYDTAGNPTKGEGWKRNRSFDLTVCNKLSKIYGELGQSLDETIRAIANNAFNEIANYQTSRQPNSGKGRGWGLNSGMLENLIVRLSNTSAAFQELGKQHPLIQDADNQLKELIDWHLDFQVSSP